MPSNKLPRVRTSSGINRIRTAMYIAYGQLTQMHTAGRLNSIAVACRRRFSHRQSFGLGQRFKSSSMSAGLMQSKVQGSRIEGVIFDLDGTLTKPHAIDFQKMRRLIGMPLDAKASSILRWIETQPIPEKEKARMLALVEHEEQKGIDRMELNDGFHQLAEVLASRADTLKTAICTRNRPPALHAFHQLLVRHGFPSGSQELFPVQIARNHFSSHLKRQLMNKPSHEPTHEVLRHWEVGQTLSDEQSLVSQFAVCSETDSVLFPDYLFVGDHLDDCLAGKRAGWSSGFITNNEDAVVESYCHTVLNDFDKSSVIDFRFGNLTDLALHLS